MTKLHLALVGLNQQKTSAVVWEQKIRNKTATGVALSSGLVCDDTVDIFSLLQKKKTNENLLENLSRKLVGLNFLQKNNAHKLETMQFSTANFEKELIYLESAILGLNKQYSGYADRAADLTKRVDYATEIAGTVDEEKLLRIKMVVDQQKKTLSYITELRDAADNKQVDLTIAKNKTNSAANKATILVENLKNRLANYNKLLLDIDRRIAAITKLSLNVGKNAFSGEFMMEVIINSFEKLQDKQEQRKKKIVEFNNTLSFLITFCQKMKITIDQLEIELNDLLSEFDRIKCSLEAKTATLSEIEKQCDMASAVLDEYFDLLIGCNFISAGSNIRLNREGCSCVISAVQPELDECPQVPISPSIPADVSILEGKLPVCPPQMCPSLPEPVECEECVDPAPCPDCPTTTIGPDPTTSTSSTTEQPCNPDDCGKLFNLGGGGRHPYTRTHNMSCYKGRVEVDFDVYGGNNLMIRVNSIMYRESSGKHIVDTTNTPTFTVAGNGGDSYFGYNGLIIYTLTCLDL